MGRGSRHDRLQKGWEEGIRMVVIYTVEVGEYDGWRGRGRILRLWRSMDAQMGRE